MVVYQANVAADKETVEQKLALLTWLFETLDIEWERDEDTFQEAASPPRPAQPVSGSEMRTRSRRPPQRRDTYNR